METIAPETKLKIAKELGGYKISIPDFLRFCRKNGITPDMKRVRGNDKDRAITNNNHV